MARLLFLLITIGVIGWLIWLMARRRNGRRRADVERTAAPEREPAALAAPAQAKLAAPEALGEREIFAKLHELALGGMAIAPAVSAEHGAVVAAVGTRLEGDIAAMSHAPRRPLLLPQLMRAVNDSEASPRELATLIARDPALAGNLLQLANSPLYRVNAQPVESVDRAVTLLGFDGIRSLIATALIQPVFRISGGEFAGYPQTIWEHTFRSAAAAEAHAAIVENSDPFAAQLTALVMGLAALIVFRAALDEYAVRRLRPDSGTVAALLDTHTARVARRIADDWELSGRILAALEDQIPGRGMTQPASLGRSLGFGRLVGALSLLFWHRRIDDETVKTVMTAAGAAGGHFERIWSRLAQLRA